MAGSNRNRIKKKPYSEMGLLEFQKKFPDEKACWEYFCRIRWPEEFKCPKCESGSSCVLANRKVIQCNSCKSQQSVTSGTIFHKSRVPLQKWFWCIYLMATMKKGASMLYLQKQLGIKFYRTVWLISHKIRHAVAHRDSQYILDGNIETDEIFIGGKPSLSSRRREGTNKTPFLIMVEENNFGGPKFLSFDELESIYKEHVVPALEKKIKREVC